MDDAFIRFSDVHKAFGPKVVLAGVDLEVRRGETLVVLGGSGSGKSVLLRHVIGLQRPDRGEVWVDGREIASRDEEALLECRKKVGMLFQAGALFDSMSVLENVAFALREHTDMHETAVVSRVREVLGLVELEGVEEMMPSDLSGGMRKRVALARAIAILTGDFGTLTVLTGQDTVFEIDGVSYKGAEGLSKLAAKPFGTATVAVGDQHMGFRRFVAQEVYAGSSVAYGTNDAVTGSVIARSGDNLSLRGATLVRKDGTVIFNDNVTIQMADSTIVTGQGPHGRTVYTIDDISVGLHISALGALSGSPGSYLLDAKQGLVRMQVTVLTGTVNNLSSGSLNLNLQTINGRKVSLFNFAGTGTTSANDADPANYQVSTGTLNLSGLGLRAKETKDLLDLYMKTRQEGFGPEVKRRILLGTYVLSAGYYDAYYGKAQAVRTLVCQDFDAAFKEVDVIVTPATPTPAFKLGEKSEDPLQMYLSDIFTISVNLAGLPAIALPCGLSKGGRPIGMQLIGRAFEEETILRAAQAYEQATQWHLKKPVIR